MNTNTTQDFLHNKTEEDQITSDQETRNSTITLVVPIVVSIVITVIILLVLGLYLAKKKKKKFCFKTTSHHDSEEEIPLTSIASDGKYIQGVKKRMATHKSSCMKIGS